MEHAEGDKEEMITEHYTCSIEWKEIPMPGFVERYHFERKDMEMILAAVRFVCETIQVEMVVGYEENGALCAVTLGNHFDQLSDLVTDNLLLSYCVECVGMELLSKSYERVNQQVYRKKGLWLGTYHFPEEEGTREGLQKLQPQCVAWKNGMLHPAKSVFFTAKYVKEKTHSGCDHCVQCGNVTCVFRKQDVIKNNFPELSNTTAVGNNTYSYGIQHIFGNVRKIQE